MAAPTDAVNPLGAFGAILDALVREIPVVGPLLPKAGPPAADEAATAAMPGVPGAGDDAVRKNAVPAGVPPSAADQSTFSAPTVAEGDVAATPVGPARTLRDMIADLSDLMAAIETALDANQPVDPAVIEKLGKTLDAVAAMIGVPVTPQPADPSAALDAQAAPSVTRPVGPASAAPYEALKGASDPVTPEAPAQNPLQRAAELMTRVASRVTDNGQALPQKLAEVAAAVANPALAPAILAKLGIEAGAAAAAEILDLPAETPKAGAKAAQPPQPFLPPALKAPELASSGEQDTSTRPRAPVDEGESTPGIDVKPAGRAEAPKTADAPVRPIASAAQVSAEPDKPASPPQAQQAEPLPVQAATPAVVRAAHAAYQAPAQPQQVSLPQLAFDIVRHVQQGQSRFEIRLDPPELGRIDVRMDMDAGGALNARLTVERAETLDLLQRDQRALERALHQAGLDSGKTNLEFSLKQSPFERPQGGPPQTWHATRGERPPQSTDSLPVPIQLYHAATTPGGINIFV